MKKPLLGRAAFEVAARDQGAGVTYLEPSASQIGHKESIKDTARVLGRMYDAIEYRGFGQEVVEELAKYAGVPVFNGLTNEFHPTQMLADALTMREHSGKPLNQTAFAYVGDARYNMGNSLLILGAKLGMDVRIGAPQSLWPSEGIIAAAHAAAKETGAKITLTENAHEAVKNVDFIHTDVWVSMGEPKEVLAGTHRFAERLPRYARTDGGIGQSASQIHALPARLPQPRNQSRRMDLRNLRAERCGSYRRSIRKPRQHRVRSGGKPYAHD